MEHRRKADTVRRRMPAMFAGAVDGQIPFGQVRFTKQICSGEEGRDERAVVEKWEQLEQDVLSLKETLAWMKDEWGRWKERQVEQEARAARDREHLAQMVLMLKREWEAMRNEHRDH